MITQGTLNYQVIGNREDRFMRIWLRDVNRHFFDALAGKDTMHLDDKTGQYYHIKIVKHCGTEICMTCHEDDNGNRYGVEDPEPEFPELPASVDLVSAGARSREQDRSAP